MASPRRRSARLRGSATPTRSFASYAANKLSSLLERDETPPATPSINAIIASQYTATKSSMPGAFDNDDSIIKTPQVASRKVLSLEEMHPSKVQQSAAKKSDTGLRPGFVDFDTVNTTPTKSTIKTVSVITPTKPVEAESKAATPNFDFRWNRPDTILSPEAQKIMESVREQAAKIKVKIQAERDEQARRNGEMDEFFGVGGRKIAKPKGKSGRYSDVHREEFKKMDSIAGHVSAWKNKFQAGAASLKRSKSKAGFDDNEFPANATDSRRLENASPGKRIRQRYQDDTSSARPVSRDSQFATGSKQNTPGLVPSKSGLPLPSAATTPTKASLARAAASVKHPQTTKIPTLGRSKSMKEMPTLSSSRTEESNKYLSSMSRVGNVKSILHKPCHKYSDDPIKVAEGTHLPTQSKMRFDKELPSLPTPYKGGIPTSPSMKHVNFTPTTKSTLHLAAASPSPSKIPAPHLLPRIPGPPLTPEKLAYPQLSRSGPLNSNPTQPGDFTFRSAKLIQFGPATSGLTSPSTIRQVRPSGIATPLPSINAMPTLPPLPAIPHGMPNKKRRRADSDDEDGENRPPGVEQVEKDEGPATKRVKRNLSLNKTAETGNSMAVKRRAESKAAKPGNIKSKGKGILSLSRLNMLARPKDRR